jgi:hypothetical protein
VGLKYKDKTADMKNMKRYLLIIDEQGLPLLIKITKQGKQKISPFFEKSNKKVFNEVRQKQFNKLYPKICAKQKTYE